MEDVGPLLVDEEAELEALLLWGRAAFLHMTEDQDVIWREELVYIVLESTLTHQPEWQMRLKVWNVRDQCNQVVTFSLKKG